MPPAGASRGRLEGGAPTRHRHRRTKKAQAKLTLQRAARRLRARRHESRAEACGGPGQLQGAPKRQPPWPQRGRS
eukprot:13796566-Alexandrium_andersonii.AAC.1